MSDDQAEKQEIGVAYDASDLRSLYGVCPRCRRVLIIIALAPALFGVSSFFDGFRGLDLFFQFVPYILMSVAITLATYFLSPLVQLRARRKNGWDDPIFVRLTEHAITTRHPSQNAQFPWSAIKKVVTTPDRLYFFTTPACAIILPRRCFVEDEQFNDWAARARKYWETGKQESFPR
ncbi:MAG: YcxB family protein [Sphingomicrobium sp.]